jgi:hypothetical protein
MRVVIERVTCDHCGQVFNFEKFNEGTKTARFETLSDWLLKIGWHLSDGVRRCDLCPTCKPLPAPQTRPILLKGLMGRPEEK